MPPRKKPLSQTKKNAKDLRQIKSRITRKQKQGVQLQIPVGWGGGNEWVSFISGIAEGSGNGKRDSDEVNITSIELRGMVQHSTSGTHNSIRVLLIRRKDTSGNIPTYGDLFAVSGGTLQDYLSQRNNVKQAQFSVVKDVTYDLMANSAKGRRSFSWFIKLPQGKTTYSGTDDQPASSSSNHYFIMAISDNNTTGYKPSLTYDYKLHYIDA